MNRNSLVALFLVLAAAPVARAADDDAAIDAVAGKSKSTHENFTPRLALGFDVFVQEFSTSFESDNVPLLNGGTRTFTSSGSTTAATPTATLDAMLLGPGFGDDHQWIRPFVRAGGQIATKPKRVVHRDDQRDAQNKFEVEMPWFWSAGAGVEFAFPLYNFEMRVRPSLEYFGEHVKYDAKVQLLEQEDPNDFNSLVDVFTGHPSETRNYHALGPRFDIEGVVARLGPISVGLYGEARFGWLFGDTEVRLTVPNGVGTGTGAYRFEADQFLAQGGAGVRLTWDGHGRE